MNFLEKIYQDINWENINETWDG